MKRLLFILSLLFIGGVIIINGNSSRLHTTVSEPVITNPDSPTTTVTGLTEGVHYFELKVTDNQGAIDRDTVQVTVLAGGNAAPIANAGPDQSISGSNTVMLNGSGNDFDGVVTTYRWIKVSGPGNITIINPNSAQTQVTNLKNGTYTFRLTVTDNNGATGTDDVIVRVNKRNRA